MARLVPKEQPHEGGRDKSARVTVMASGTVTVRHSGETKDSDPMSRLACFLG